MSTFRFAPRLLILSALSLHVAATAARAQVGTANRPSDVAPVVRSDSRASPRVSSYPKSKDEWDVLLRNRPADARRMASSAISDGRRALDAKPPQYLKAMRLFDYAARLNPKDERALVGLGDLYVATRLFSEAEMAYSKALKIKWKSGEAHYGLGVVYHAQGRLDAARDELQVLRSLKKKKLAAKLEALLAG